MPEPFVSAVPKLLDVVNVPVAYSFDYACQLITIPAGQTRRTNGEQHDEGRMSKHKENHRDHLPR